MKHRTLAAVADSNDLILHAEQTSLNTSYSSVSGETQTTQKQDRWQDMTEGRTRIVAYGPDGLPREEFYSSHTSDSMTMDMLDYAARTWTTADLPTSAGAFDGGGSQQFAQQIEGQLANGALVLVGPAMIDGRETFHLRRPLPKFSVPAGPNGFRPPQPAELDMWIDPTSFLPVAEETLAGNGEVLSRTDDEWLPRTPANLAEVNFVAPPGLKHETAATSSSASGADFSWQLLVPSSHP